MRTLLVILAILFPLTVVAAKDIVMRNDDGRGNYARLFAVPCANDVILARTPTQYRPELLAGEVFIEGKLYSMCWLALPDATVGMLYEDGDFGRLPATAFRPETNA